MYREIYGLEHWEPWITKEEKTYNYTIQFRINRIFTVINFSLNCNTYIINCKQKSKVQIYQRICSRSWNEIMARFITRIWAIYFFHVLSSPEIPISDRLSNCLKPKLDAVKNYCKPDSKNKNNVLGLVYTLLWILGEVGESQVSCKALWQWSKHEFINIPPLVEFLKKFINAPNMSVLNPANEKNFWFSSYFYRLSYLNEPVGIEPWSASSWCGLHAVTLTLQRFQRPVGSAEGGTSPWWNCLTSVT